MVWTFPWRLRNISYHLIYNYHAVILTQFFFEYIIFSPGVQPHCPEQPNDWGCLHLRGPAPGGDDRIEELLSLVCRSAQLRRHQHTLIKDGPIWLFFWFYLGYLNAVFLTQLPKSLQKVRAIHACVELLCGNNLFEFIENLSLKQRLLSDILYVYIGMCTVYLKPINPIFSRRMLFPWQFHLVVQRWC